MKLSKILGCKVGELTFWKLMAIRRQPAVGWRQGAGVGGVLGALVLVQDHHAVH